MEAIASEASSRTHKKKSLKGLRSRLFQPDYSIFMYVTSASNCFISTRTFLVFKEEIMIERTLQIVPHRYSRDPKTGIF